MGGNLDNAQKNTFFYVRCSLIWTILNILFVYKKKGNKCFPMCANCFCMSTGKSYQTLSFLCELSRRKFLCHIKTVHDRAQASYSDAHGSCIVWDIGTIIYRCWCSSLQAIASGLWPDVFEHACALQRKCPACFCHFWLPGFERRGEQWGLKWYMGSMMNDWLQWQG